MEGATRIQESTSSSPCTTSIQHLPFEVLAEIFETTTAPHLTAESTRRLMSLCLVCRAWREAALAHHPLWRALAVTVPFKPSVYDKVQAWLARAGTVPKSLAVQARYHQWCVVADPDDNADEVEDYSDPYECHFERYSLARQLLEGATLDHLSLYCASSECLRNLTNRLNQHAINGKMNSSAPWFNLRSLRIVINSEWVVDPETRDAVYEMLRRLPPVTSLHFHLPGFKRHLEPLNSWGEPHRIVIPAVTLAPLTCFTLDCDWHYITVLEIVRSCTNLEVLTLHFKSSTLGYTTPFSRTSGDLRPVEDGSSPLEDISLPLLRVLRFRQSNPDGMRILRQFSTLNVEELDISFANAGFRWHTVQDVGERRWEDHIALYANKSGGLTSLRRFRLQGVTMSSDRLEHLVLTSLSRATELMLDGVAFKDGGVELPLLSRSPVVAPAQPRLRVVRTYREKHDPPLLEDDDSDWSTDSNDTEFDSWEFNLGVRESLLHTLEHDYL